MAGEHKVPDAQTEAQHLQDSAHETRDKSDVHLYQEVETYMRANTRQVGDQGLTAKDTVTGLRKTLNKDAYEGVFGTGEDRKKVEATLSQMAREYAPDNLDKFMDQFKFSDLGSMLSSTAPGRQFNHLDWGTDTKTGELCLAIYDDEGNVKDSIALGVKYEQSQH